MCGADNEWLVERPIFARPDTTRPPRLLTQAQGTGWVYVATLPQLGKGEAHLSSTNTCAPVVMVYQRGSIARLQVTSKPKVPVMV